ncbi:MAG: tetratricopeptide repeat protein [Bacteroidota bacterium]|nr:tetratricopeptide repeat protein [Bacteroidota bacterium]
MKQKIKTKEAKKYIENKNKLSIQQMLIIVVAFIVTIIAFSPSVKNGITNFDDSAYVTENPLIQELSFENIKTIFSESYYGGYYPLTILSFGLDLKFGKKNPVKTLHLINLLLHLANTLLVFWLLFLLLKNFNIAIIAAALFGVHTMHVESVAWISERKDVLYAFFFLLSLIFYTKYINEKKQKFYFWALALFLFSILSKTMAASLAVTIVAIDYFFDRKILSKKVLIEKIPFLLIAIAFGLISILSQKEAGMITDSNQLLFFEKIVYAFYGFSIYSAKLIFPFHLSAFYPYPETFSLQYLLFILPVGVIVFLFFYFLKRAKIIAFGILFFTLNIVLVLQILQINNFVIADRFVYVASIGVFLIIGYLYDYFLQKKIFSKNVLNVVIIAYLGLLTFKTNARCEVWKSSLTLWDNVIEQHPDRIPKAYYWRGHAQVEMENYKASINDFTKVIELQPENYEAMAYHSRATTYANLGEIDKALKDIELAIEIDNENASFYILRARINYNNGNKNEAIKDYNKVVELNPDDYVAYYFRAHFFAQEKQYQKAIDDFSKALELNSEFGEIFYNRGIIYQTINKNDNACKDFRKASNLGYERANSMILSYCF